MKIHDFYKFFIKVINLSKKSEILSKNNNFLKIYKNSIKFMILTKICQNFWVINRVPKIDLKILRSVEKHEI